MSPKHRGDLSRDQRTAGHLHTPPANPPLRAKLSCRPEWRALRFASRTQIHTVLKVRELFPGLRMVISPAPYRQTWPHESTIASLIRNNR
jgi:hypothetical protein